MPRAAAGPRTRHAARCFRTEVSVPAGTFEAWVVDVTDASGDATTDSRVFVAERLGLVRSVQPAPEGQVTYELTSVSSPPDL